jgi:hypothetical protein
MSAPGKRNTLNPKLRFDPNKNLSFSDKGLVAGQAGSGTGSAQSKRKYDFIPS